MKYMSLILAALALSLVPTASAKAFQCVNGDLVGGPEGFSCRLDPDGRIVDVRKRDTGPYGTRPMRAGSHGYAYNDSYTRTQTYTAPRTTTKIVRYRTERPPVAAAAPRVTRTYSYSAPSHQPASEVREVRVYRSGTASGTRPCSYYAPASSVTTYTGCSHSHATHEPRRVTMYLDAEPQLAGGPHTTAGRAPYQGPHHVPSHAPQSPVYDHVPVVGVRAGYCNRKVDRIDDDADGRTRYEVCYADLQPVNGGRIETLYSRIETAARRACGRSAGYGAYRRASDCRDQAVDMAVYDTGLQPLVNYHVAKTGGRPRVIVGPLRRY